MSDFIPNSFKQFNFTEIEFDPMQMSLKLDYQLDQIKFTELWSFPNASYPRDPSKIKALNQAFRLLHLISGISYYKMAVPNIIKTNYKLDPFLSEFLNKTYQNGLAEFGYRNSLSLDHINFVKSNQESFSEKIELRKKIILPLGGGKDSIVTGLALEKAGIDFTLFSLGTNPIFKKIANQFNKPLISIQRKLDPLMIELNQQGALNGHVPISAIIAAALGVCAILYDFDQALISNENSSNQANLYLNGRAINHQYSKSFEFEKDFTEVFNKTCYQGFKYQSFIREISEIEVARLFLKDKRFDEIFISCNSVYKYNNQNKNWCCACPKCHFVFLALAASSEPERLINIFGKNILDDLTQFSGFEELLGKVGQKPFECVGEIEESIFAFKLISKHSSWKNSKIVEEMLKKYPDLNQANQINYFEQTYQTNLDSNLREVLNDFR